jgi:hypothetical protein
MAAARRTCGQQIHGWQVASSSIDGVLTSSIHSGVLTSSIHGGATPLGRQRRGCLTRTPAVSSAGGGAAGSTWSPARALGQQRVWLDVDTCPRSLPPAAARLARRGRPPARSGSHCTARPPTRMPARRWRWRSQRKRKGGCGEEG